MHTHALLELATIVDTIVAGWRALLRAQRTPAPRAIGGRGVADERLAAAVVRAALGGIREPQRAGELTDAARAFADLPRRRRFDARALHRELAMLRHATWVVLRDCFTPGAERVAFLKALDRAVLQAHRAAVEGRAAPRATPSARVDERRSPREVRF